MTIKKIIIGISTLIFLTGCAQNAAFLGPVYTMTTSGNIYHAGFTYGGNEVITKTTGKTVAQNLKEAVTPKKEDTEFQKLVKRNIKKTREKLKLSNQ